VACCKLAAVRPLDHALDRANDSVEPSLYCLSVSLLGYKILVSLALCLTRPRTTHDTIPSCAIPSRIFVAVLRARNPHSISGIGGGTIAALLHPLPTLITSSAHLRLFSIEPRVVVVVRWKDLKAGSAGPRPAPTSTFQSAKLRRARGWVSEAHILTNETVFQLIEGCI